MTTQPMPTAAQRVIVAGTVDLQRQRQDRRTTVDVPVVQRRNGARAGKVDQVLLQLRSPYGESFALSVDVPQGIPGAALLDAAEANTLLVFEGELQTRDIEQRQYAVNPTDSGRHIQKLVLVPTSVRQPTEAETTAFTACWLSGQILEPPRLMRHPAIPAIQLVLTRVRLSGARAATNNPYLSGPLSPQEITIAVPLMDENAPCVFKPGNVVQIVGQLECIEEEQRGPHVAAAVAALDAEWNAGSEARVGLNAEERRQQERRYRINRARLVEGTRMLVLASEVVLEAGAVITLDEAMEQRREFQAEARARRARNAQRARQYAAQVAANGGTTRNLEQNRAFLAQTALAPEGGSEGGERRRRRTPNAAAVPGPVLEEASGENGHAEEPVGETVLLVSTTGDDSA